MATVSGSRTGASTARFGLTRSRRRDADVRTHDVHADATARRRRHRAAVVRPGRKIRSRMSRSPRRASASAVTNPPRRAAHRPLPRRCRDRRRPLRCRSSRPVRGAQTSCPAAPCLAAAHLFRLDAGDGIPDEVDQRIGHQLDDGGVQLDGLTRPRARRLAGRPRAVPTIRTNGATDGRRAPCGRGVIWPRSSPLSRCTPPASSRTTRTSPVSSCWISVRSLEISPTRRASRLKSSYGRTRLVEELSQRRIPGSSELPPWGRTGGTIRSAYSTRTRRRSGSCVTG